MMKYSVNYKLHKVKGQQESSGPYMPIEKLESKCVMNAPVTSEI